MAKESTYASLVSNFADFLTVAIHTILYERQIYPIASFITTRKYNYAVRQSRHPKVCAWITDAVSAVQDELIAATLDKVAVVIYSPYSLPLERFVFDLSKFPVVAREDMHTPIDRESPAQLDGSKPPSVDLEEQFRAVMARLCVCGTTLKPIPPGCTFTVTIEVKDAAEPPIRHPQLWIPVQPSLQRQVENPGADESTEKLGEDLGGVKTTPIRAVDAGEMAFEMWVEEGKGKIDALSSKNTTQTSE